MKTYIIYEKETEVFRGTMPDCCEHIESQYTYNDIFNVLHIIIMCPYDIDYIALSKQYQTEMQSVLTYKSRENFNKKLSYLIHLKRVNKCEQPS